MKGSIDEGNNSLVILKPQSRFRWIILLLSCVMMVGSYYAYDIPAALKSPLDDYMGNPDDFETLFSLLFTVYSIPNTILPLLGGYIVDRFGFRLCAILFASLTTAGQAILCVGISVKSWPLMFVGRVVFGFGGESISVANSAILAEYFIGKELAFAFGLGLSIARLGSVINNVVSPGLDQGVSLTFAFWFGTILCAGSLFCTLCIWSIDKGLEAVIKKNKQKLGVQDVLVDDNLNSPLLIEGEKDGSTAHDGKDATSDQGEIVKISDALKLSFPFWLLTVSCVVVYGCVLPFNNIASSLLMERDYFKAQPDDNCALEYAGCQNATNVANAFCDTSEWYQPPLPFEYNDGAIFQYSGDDVDCNDDYWSEECTPDYCNGKDDAEVQATLIMSIPYFISAALSPFLGKFVDIFGKRAVIACLAPGVLIIVHSLMGYTDVTPVGPLVGQGLSYAGFAAVIWPSIPLVVPAKFTGLAYGICTCLQNVGLAIFPVIIAAIYEATDHTYIPEVETFFVSLACLGCLVGVYLNYYDANNGHIFNNPGKKIEDPDAEIMNRKMSVGSFTVNETVERARMMSK